MTRKRAKQIALVAHVAAARRHCPVPNRKAGHYGYYKFVESSPITARPRKLTMVWTTEVVPV